MPPSPEEILEEQTRMQEVKKLAEERRALVYPNTCPTCAAKVGQQCRTKTGKRTMVHAARCRR